jgi:hypothetical protein
MTLLLQEGPMWTDVWQTIAALIGIPATIVGFIILFVKDHNKENQIKKLSEIASNLQDMVVSSEKRYIQTRKPIINIRVEVKEDIKAVKLRIYNFNQTSQVQSCEPIDFERSKYDILSDDMNHETQELGMLFYYDRSPEEYDRSVIQIRYQMTEGYTFKQILRFYYDPTTNVEVKQDPILEMSAPDF